MPATSPIIPMMRPAFAMRSELSEYLPGSVSDIFNAFFALFRAMIAMIQPKYAIVARDTIPNIRAEMEFGRLGFLYGIPV